MVSTPWLCGLCVAHGILNAVARSWTEEDESCNGQGLLLLQMGGDRVAGVGRLQFQEPNLNRWMVQFFLATILVGSMILFCCFVPRTGTETAAGAALVDKLRPHLESSDCKTFNDYVTYWALKTSEKTTFRFCDASGEESDTRSCSSLKARSSQVAQMLLEISSCGDRILLVYEPGLDFLDAFIGSLLSCRTAVPVYPPVPTQASSVQKFTAIQADCGAKVALTSSKYWWSTAAFINADWPEISWKVTSNLKVHEDVTMPTILPHNLAFLQYTSGSTGAPKGVMVSHENLLTNCLIPPESPGNCRSVQRDEAQIYGPNDVVLIWLPQYHDMGLVCGYLTSVVWNCQTVGISPMDFIQDPLLWPKLITRYRATHTIAPHFGYQLTARRMELAGPELLDLDLSSLTVALDGAEPINVRTRLEMLRTWKRFGLREGVYSAAYGLAEHVVKVACGGPEHVAEEFASTRAAECGTSGEGICLKIVDPVTKTEVPEGQEGEIWLDSPSKGCGYWGKPELTEEIFHARLHQKEEQRTFLRTGDMGVVRGGRLYVCGRIKNVIIVGGKNFHPQDIEQTVQEASEHVRPGHVVACSNSAVTEEEQLLLAVELRDPHVYPESLASSLRCYVEKEHGLAVWGLVLLRPRSLPKTTSGKLQHRQVAQLWASSFGSAVVECHLWGRSLNSLNKIDWSRVFDRSGRARLIEEWLLAELEGATPESKLADLSLSSVSLAQLHARLLAALQTSGQDFSELYRRCPGPSQDLAKWSEDTYLRISVETAFPISSLFGANLRALALAVEEAKFPPRSAVVEEGGQSGRREVIEKMPVKGAKQVAPWIVWTWKTFGLLMPLLILVTPFFLVSTMLDLMHQKGGHRLVVAAAPLLVGGIWASLLFQVWILRLALFPRGLSQGRHKVNSSVHLRLWQLDVALTFLHRFGMVYRGTPVHNALLTALGARIGHGARLQLSARASCQLLRVGAGCVVEESSVKCHCQVDGEVILAAVELACCSVARRCVVEPGATLHGVVLRPLSTVPMGATAEAKDAKVLAAPGCVDWLKFFYVLVIHPYAFVGMLYIMFLGFQRAHGFLALMVGATVSLMLAGSTALMLFVLLKWLLVGRLRPGTLPVFRYGCFRVSTWILASANIFISSVPEWLLRFSCYLCGAEVAGAAELTMPSWLRVLEGGELVRIGSNTFLGGLSDFALQGQGADKEFHEVHIGEDCYLGAGSFLDSGCHMEAGASVAACSYVPPGELCLAAHTFAGNPAVAIGKSSSGTRREKRCWLQWFLHGIFLPTLQRAISLQPLVLLPTFSFWMKQSSYTFCSDLGFFWWRFCLTSAAGYFLALLLCIAIYWAGVTCLRLTSKDWPVTTLTENTLGSHLWKMVMEALFLSRLWTSLLLQTPWFSTFLRLLGARVGARVCFDDDLGFHEPWLLEIGDDSQFGVARLSPHSMELDGSIILQRLVIGRNVTLLEEASVFGGTQVPDRCLLGSLCRPLKGQQLEAREYNSTPAR